MIKSKLTTPKLHPEEKIIGFWPLEKWHAEYDDASDKWTRRLVGIALVEAGYLRPVEMGRLDYPDFSELELGFRCYVHEDDLANHDAPHKIGGTARSALK